MKNVLIWFITVYMVLDIVSFFAWAFSGQIPIDGFYLGIVTHKILLFITSI